MNSIIAPEDIVRLERILASIEGNRDKDDIAFFQKVCKIFATIFKILEKNTILRRMLLREFGFLRKSEKGEAITEGGSPGGDSGAVGDIDNKKADGDIGLDPDEDSKRRSGVPEAAAKLARYRAWLLRQKALRKNKQKKGHVPPDLKSSENIVDLPLCAKREETEILRVEDQVKVAEFGCIKGLHSTYDEVVRHDIEITLVKKNIRVETLTSPFTGKSVRADITELGPPNSQMTWNAIDKILKFIINISIPFEKVASMFGGSPFDSGQISRIVTSVARKLLFVYLYLAEIISKSRYIHGDDTSLKVLEMIKKYKNNQHLEVAEDDDELIKKSAEVLGRTFLKKDGSGAKRSIHTTVLVAREDQNDRASTIYFYRTHYGEMGEFVVQNFRDALAEK